jgi:3'-phosphoadenosine 5'-phosphosulfate (PAPS) 3'-phosphatase
MGTADYLSAENINVIITTTLQIGKLFNDYIFAADSARSKERFVPGSENFKDFFARILPGTRVKLFEGFHLGKKLDGSPVCTADKRSHNILTEIFDNILSGVPRFLEENNKTESIAASSQLRASRKNLVICADELDNTKGFLASLFNTPYHNAHQFSINLAVSPRNNVQGFGCFYLPLRDTLYYCHEGKAYKIDKATTDKPVRKLIQFNKAPDEPIRIVTSNSAENPDKSPRQRRSAITRDQELKDLVENRTGKSTELLHATGINRIAMLLNGEADIAKSGAGMCWWDVRAGFEICRAAGLAVATHPENSMPKFPSTESLPELYFGNAELLKEMGLKIVYGKDVTRTPAAKMQPHSTARQLETIR